MNIIITIISSVKYYNNKFKVLHIIFYSACVLTKFINLNNKTIYCILFSVLSILYIIYIYIYIWYIINGVLYNAFIT